MVVAKTIKIARNMKERLLCISKIKIWILSLLTTLFVFAILTDFFVNAISKELNFFFKDQMNEEMNHNSHLIETTLVNISNNQNFSQNKETPVLHSGCFDDFVSYCLIGIFCYCNT